MISGSFYSYDFINIMENALKESNEKYSLNLMNREVTSVYDYSNSDCIVSYFISDIQSLKWEFYNPNAINRFVYQPFDFMEFILNIKRPRFVFEKSVNSLELKIEGFFINFNRELLNYMSIPMSGDFSWHDTYIEKLKQRLIYSEFAFLANSSHSNERREVSRMCRREEEGWEQAIETYFKKHYPDGGKEFEVDDIFKNEYL